MRRLTGLLLMLTFVGCGPEQPFEVGAREFPVDILLGEGEATEPPPPFVRSDPAPIAFPGFIEPPMPRPTPGVQSPPEPPAPECPTAHPFDGARLPAFVRASLPPAIGSYTFRNGGYVQVAGGPRLDYPRRSTRAVTEQRPLGGEGNYDFDVEAELAGSMTTTTYRLRNSGAQPDRGLFLVRVRQDGSVFTPQPPIMLMPFPEDPGPLGVEDERRQLTGQSYSSAGTDPLAGTTMAIEARIAPKDRFVVDACGEWIDAWEVVVEAGRIVGPTQDIGFTGSFFVATQYGGLIVRDDIEMSGRDGFDLIETYNLAVINELPLEP